MATAFLAGHSTSLFGLNILTATARIYGSGSANYCCRIEGTRPIL